VPYEELCLPHPKLFRLLVLVVFVLAPLPLWGNGYGSSQAENLEKVRAFLSARSLDFEERPLLASFGGFSSSIHVRFSGPALRAASPEAGKETFVLAIPLDSGFAVDTGLALIERLETALNPPQTLVAFLGDEKAALPGDIPSYGYKGLRDLLSLCEMPETWVLCYLDAREPPEGILISHGSGKYIAPLQTIKPLPLLLSSAGIPSSFEIRYNEIYKLGLAEENRVLTLAWEGEINGFCLSGAYGKGNAGQPVKSGVLADTLLEYAHTIVLPLQNPDRHYSIIPSVIPLFGKTSLFISEKTMVVFFVSASAVLIFSFLVFSEIRRSRIAGSLKNFFRYSWIILALLPLLMAIIKGAGFVYSLLLFLFKVSPPPGDYTGIAFTVLLALLFFSLTAPLVKFFAVPGKAGFFGFSAVILVILGTFLSIIMDFTFLPVFIWASFFTFLGALFKHPVLVFICALLIPLQILMAFFNIKETSGGKLAELLLSGWGGPGWVTALQIAAPALPFALLLERGFGKAGLWVKGSKKSRAGLSAILRLGLLGLVLALMVIRILAIPSPPPPPERRSFIDRNGEILTISTEHTIFEESRIIEVTMEAKGDPLRFDLYLEGENLSPVYSSPAPFNRGYEGKSIEFILGENPPNPFKAEIVLPRESAVSVRGKAFYTRWESAPDREDKPGTEDYVFTVISEARLPAAAIN
jgi:hypothetical protein